MMRSATAQAGVEICIATPGRLIDYLEGGKTNMKVGASAGTIRMMSPKLSMRNMRQRVSVRDRCLATGSERQCRACVACASFAGTRLQVCVSPSRMRWLQRTSARKIREGMNDESCGRTCSL